jgi:Galactose oxidase, central domain
MTKQAQTSKRELDTRRLASTLAIAASLVLQACGGGSSSSGSNSPGGTGSFTVGGSVSGLTTTGLRLASGSNSVQVQANSTSFVLPSPIQSGSAYAIAVSQEPAGLSCNVANGTGVVQSSNVTSVSVTCGKGWWAWVSGTEGPAGSPGMYGTKGVAAASNVPGGRLGTATWTDTAGNLWLFGGFGVDASGNSGELNDLWTYSPATQQWTWVSGSSANYDLGNYGTRGVPSPTNVPSARDSSAAWSDGAGNFWLFGGNGMGQTNNGSSPGLLNDLWEFIPSTLQWVWVGGAANFDAPLGVYGTLGVAAAGNFPAAREQAVAWRDQQGTVWMYGGLVSTPNAPDDLWRYEAAANLWTWMGGNDIHNVPVYGSQGVADAGNTPGMRRGAVGWTDKSGNLWLLGGWGELTAGGESLTFGDLWKYDPSTGLWSWISGPNNGNAVPVYGVLGIAASTNQPGGRAYSVSWVDSTGKFLLLSGVTQPIGGTEHGLSDLWSYDPSINEWTWVGGSDQLDAGGSYGTLGIPSPANFPGAREQAAGWSGRTGDVWLFGGLPLLGIVRPLNDLWKVNPP